MKSIKYILIGTLVALGLSFAQSSFACVDECNTGNGPFGDSQNHTPHVVQNPYSTLPMPTIFSSGTPLPSSSNGQGGSGQGGTGTNNGSGNTVTLKPIAQPQIYGANGKPITSSNNSSSGTSTTSSPSGSSLLGSLFGKKNSGTFGSNESTINSGETLTTDLTQIVNTKGLAIGTLNNGACDKNGNNQYLILFKNITNQTLTNVALRVYLPDNVTFKSTTLGTYSELDHSVTAFLGTLTPSQLGQVLITGTPNGKTTSGVARAELVYTDQAGIQHMLVSYAFENDGRCVASRLSGFAGGSGGSFFPTTLFGWLMLALFISLLVFISRFFLRKPALHGAHAH